MKLTDLPILLKGVAFKSTDIKKYMVNLLHKFEVALQWDDVHLLIPSLLPTDKIGLEEFVMVRQAVYLTTLACCLSCLSTLFRILVNLYLEVEIFPQDIITFKMQHL